MPDDAVRPVDPHFAATPSNQTGFSDGFPLLLVNRALLDALNARLEVPVPGQNLVHRGVGSLRIGDVLQVGRPQRHVDVQLDVRRELPR